MSAIEFMVVARVSRSNLMGPASPESDLVSATFVVALIKAEQVSECGNQ
jgi:hypothetical protein